MLQLAHLTVLLPHDPEKPGSVTGTGLCPGWS
jgi:hypothetical protein